LLAVFAAGCGRLSRPPDFSESLLQWIESRRFSSWQAFRDPTGRIPRRPDGFTLGNRHIFAGIGCSDNDLTQIAPLYGDRKSLQALPAPLVFSLERAGESLPLAGLKEQTLSRIFGASIPVSESEDEDFHITITDFAPLGEELNCLVRLVVVRNKGEKSRFSLLFSSTLGELKQQNRSTIIAGRLGILSDHPLQIADEDASQIKIDLGSIERGDSRSAAIILVPAKDEGRMEEDLEKARQVVLQNPLNLLETTQKEWNEWRAQVKVETEDERLEDLIDSLLCMMKSHIGFDAVHTGSLRYPHTRAWVRDNYWVQRALLEAGLKEEAKLNLDFFFSAWKDSGLSSYYEISTRKGEPYGNPHVELPHYLVLMVRDAEQLGGIDGKDYWPMVKGCLEKAGVPESGLQPINGDETWLLAAAIDQTDYVLDNSWLLIASSEYGAALARRMGDNESAEEFEALAKKARQAAESSFFSPRLGRFVIARSGSAPAERGMDEFPAAGVLARPVIFGLYPADDPRIHTGLLDAWRNLYYLEGVRAYSRSGMIDGGTPGYFLYALSEARLPSSHVLVNRLMAAFCSETGNVWELESAADPKWSLEKRRLWDSAVLLMGLLHYARLHDSIPPLKMEPIDRPEVERITRAKKGPIIFEKDSFTHARELASQLARHFGKAQRVEKWTGELPIFDHMIVISPTLPSPLIVDASLPAGENYSLCTNPDDQRHGADRVIVWVKNRGDVFADLRGLEYDLFRMAVPQREAAPFPDSDLRTAEEIGERPSGEVKVKVTSGSPLSISCAGKAVESQSAEFSLDLRKEVSTPPAHLRIRAATESKRIVALTVSARGGPEALAKVEVTFPVGYWVLEARGLKGGWDRTVDPIEEILRPDGSRTFIFQVRLGRGVDKSFTLRLARPAVLSVSAEPEPPRR
jgi:hypothetical protein